MFNISKSFFFIFRHWFGSQDERAQRCGSESDGLRPAVALGAGERERRVTLRGGSQVAHAVGGGERAGAAVVPVQRRGQRREELDVAEVGQRAARIVDRWDQGVGPLLVWRGEYTGTREGMVTIPTHNISKYSTSTGV